MPCLYLKKLNNNNNMDCLICFCPVETTYISCYNNVERYSTKPCQGKVCDECAIHLINYSDNGSILPICPATGCNAIYPSSEIKKLGIESFQKYNNAILKYLVKNNGEDAKKKNEYEKMLSKLRNERKIFVQNHFPAAIYKISSISFPHKLRRLEKSKKEHANEKIKNSKKTCFNLSCHGFLDSSLNDHYECLTCSTKFCKKCEKILTPIHVCKKEDLESVTFINSLIKCPSCLLPIQKSEGCNGMTCSNCGATFDYATGKLSGHGSFNQKFESRNLYKLTHEFRHIDPSLMNLLLEFESKIPNKPTKTFMSTLTEIYKLEETDVEIIKKYETKLVNQYIAYLKSKYRYKKYIILANKIETHLRKKDVTIEFLQECLNF